MSGLELYQSAELAVSAGEYDEAMQLLEEVDQTGEVAAPITTNLRHVIATRRAEASAGISSLTSDDKLDKSGDSTTDTASSDLSPAPTTENLSLKDLPVDPAQSSTASSASGSTQETGSSQPSQPDSSVESPAKEEASTAQPSEVPVAVQKTLGVENPVTLADQRAGTPAPVSAEEAANNLITMARDEYTNKNYDRALSLVDDAEALFPGIAETAAQARTAIQAAKGFAPA